MSYFKDINFYFVGKGICKITVKDKRGREIFIRNIYPGDHFGEISAIYGCKRTANVISMNYNTFSVMGP